MKTTRSPGANSGEPSSRLRITACHPLMRARKRRSALGWGWIDSISTTLAITEDMGFTFRAHGLSGEAKDIKDCKDCKDRHGRSAVFLCTWCPLGPWYPFSY